MSNTILRISEVGIPLLTAEASDVVSIAEAQAYSLAQRLDCKVDIFHNGEYVCSVRVKPHMEVFTLRK